MSAAPLRPTSAQRAAVARDLARDAARSLHQLRDEILRHGLGDGGATALQAVNDSLCALERATSALQQPGVTLGEVLHG